MAHASSTSAITYYANDNIAKGVTSKTACYTLQHCVLERCFCHYSCSSLLSLCFGVVVLIDTTPECNVSFSECFSVRACMILVHQSLYSA
jgi:hypothetical protein